MVGHKGCEVEPGLGEEAIRDVGLVPHVIEPRWYITLRVGETAGSTPATPGQIRCGAGKSRALAIR